MKNEKKVMLLSLTILAILLTGFTWAYWHAGEIKGATLDHTNTIKVGASEKTEVVTTLAIDPLSEETKTVLVPRTVNKENSQLKILYKATWDTESEFINGAKGEIKISKPTIAVKGKENDPAVNKILDDLFKTKIENKDIRFQPQYLYMKEVPREFTKFEVTVEFHKEPSSKNDYDLIANKDLVVSFNVQIVPVQ